MGNLPLNFFERVVDLENKIGGRDYNEDEAASVTMISELMRLYSVSINIFVAESKWCSRLPSNFITGRLMKVIRLTTSKNFQN